MTTISSATDTQSSAAAASAAAAAAASSKPDVGEEFNTFLKLLTAQLRNQDPLSPLDSTQFVEQLATFSSLEQQVKSNTSLETIATLMGDLHAFIASEWLGQTVSVESSWVPYSASPVQFSVDMPEGVDRATLTVKDNTGNAVWSEELDPADESYTWDGLDSSGNQIVPEGLYEFGIDLFRGDQYIGTAAPRVITTVTDIGNENGALVLGTASKLTTGLNNARKVED
ncbi:flagellar hook assembly protein FlgD [Hyphomonas johnsonii]|uniref:Basal-body rod modification protein FlgD n=1 Tax=Hyphomonas johnsonii MHS-2 TaxID=1280950 RepID=A0A059FNM8_9PROT|nr:flagellar hook capping FlgD N-terminal domain-containing protein [Hyphomonas johnsonii]KCZ92227.1 putative basal-body rod modification protein FlgD [Hyphomonas johnsonii MHS-2]